MNELNNCFLRIFLKLIISSEVKAIKGFSANNNNSCKLNSLILVIFPNSFYH